MTTLESPASRPFQVLHRNGSTPLQAEIPTHLTIGVALPEIATYAGYPAEPDISQRYALLAAPGTGGDYLLLPDDATFGDVAENSVLRLAPQPRPA
jgi:hypothetical protein